MKKYWLFSLALLAALVMAVPALAQISINGAGATFPQPVYRNGPTSITRPKGSR